jgi:hypothetical protein
MSIHVMIRKVITVNLDPSNDHVPYDVSVDIRNLIDIEKIMDQLDLGPNGAILYCMEYLEQNVNWLKEQIEALSISSHQTYVLFDCPGQVELYTHHESIRKVISEFTRWNYQLAAIQLIEVYHCMDPFKYLSAVLMSLTTMLHLGLPHINVLSKVDLMESFGALPFNLDFYTEVQDLNYLLPYLEGTWEEEDNPLAPIEWRQRIFSQKYRGISRALVDLIQDYNLVNFLPLAIEDQECMTALISVIDKANSYVALLQEKEHLLEHVSRTEKTNEGSYITSIMQERYTQQSSDSEPS